MELLSDAASPWSLLRFSCCAFPISGEDPEAGENTPIPGRMHNLYKGTYSSLFVL